MVESLGEPRATRSWRIVLGVRRLGLEEPVGDELRPSQVSGWPLSQGHPRDARLGHGGRWVGAEEGPRGARAGDKEAWERGTSESAARDVVIQRGGAVLRSGSDILAHGDGSSGLDITFSGFNKVISATEKPLSVAGKVFSGLDKVFSAWEKAFSGLEKVISVAEKPLYVTEKVISGVEKVISGTDQSLGATDKSRSRAAQVASAVDSSPVRETTGAAEPPITGPVAPMQIRPLLDCCVVNIRGF